jgi:hypothetical protein
VNDLEAWWQGRRPVPPPDLAAALASDLAGSMSEGLTREAQGRLDQARARPGRTRESAFRLLEADALLTYACEAALESERPEAALLGILSAIGS